MVTSPQVSFSQTMQLTESLWQGEWPRNGEREQPSPGAENARNVQEIQTSSGWLQSVDRKRE